MSSAADRQQEILGKPPRIAPLRPDEIGPEARAITEKLRKAAGAAALDDIPEYVATMLRHPGLYDKHVALGAELFENGALSPRQRELAVLRTAWLLGAPYEWGEHVVIGKRAGLSDEEVERIKQGSGATGWSTQDRAIVRAAEELREGAMISDATWLALSDFLDDKQLIEIPFVIGNYTRVAYLQNSLRLRLIPGNAGLSAR